MTEKTWTIDTVQFEHPKDRNPFFHVPEGMPVDAIRCITKGRTADGRRFWGETWITQALWKDAGENVVVQLVKDQTRPPVN